MLIFLVFVWAMNLELYIEAEAIIINQLSWGSNKVPLTILSLSTGEAYDGQAQIFIDGRGK